jgi:hypothetical protein
MKMKHTGMIILGIVLYICFMVYGLRLTAIAGTNPTVAAAAECERACLEGFANKYIEALVAHDPARVPIAKNVKFTENGQMLEIGDALWGTASDTAKTYRIYITDPKTGQVAFSGVIKESGKDVLFVFRLKIAAGKIAEIEQIVVRDTQFVNMKNLTTPDPIYAEVLAPSERSSREDMIRIADSYFVALQRSTGKRPVPFADTCNRLENGMQTTNNPQMGGASSDGFSITALSCTEQFKTGYFKFVTKIRRRWLVIDEERGLAASVAFLDHAGTVKEVTLNDGRTLPVTLSSPTTLMGSGFAKIKNGKIHRIHTFLISVPYGMGPGWPQ